MAFQSLFYRLATLCLASLGFFSPLQASDLLIQHSAKPLQAEATVDALSFWETPLEGFFVRSHHPVPTVDPSTWVLQIDGLVDRELKLSLSDLRSLPLQSLHAVLQCSGNRRGKQTPSVPGVQWEKGAVGNAQWKGVALSDLLRKAGVQAKGRYLRLEGADEPALPGVPKFIRSIPIEKAAQIPALIAFEMNRVPLPVLHGGPLRLILPGWYGENWMKWLQHITVTEQEDPGFYMSKGYRMPKAPVRPLTPWDAASGVAIEELQVQSFMTSPKEGTVTFPGPVAVRGKAFSGAGKIVRVDISTDGGESWLQAQLEPPHQDGGWQEFSLELAPPKLGRLTLLSKATDSHGKQQPLNSPWNPGGYLKNEVDQVSILISQQPQQLARGAEILRQRCATCHSLELVTSQRLAASQWDSTLKKMNTFGVILTPSDRKTLLEYLLHLSPSQPRSQPHAVTYASVNPNFWQLELIQGNSNHGAQLFKTNCTACHGAQGEGLAGPRLKGRQLSTADFWTTVKWGRELMPSFNDKLKDQEIADIRSYLLKVLD